MDVAAAIADPVRREILTVLRRGPLPAGAIAARFAISRPAVSRHLRVLRESGLVVDRTQGRERVYRLEVAPLAELDAWLAQFRDGWSRQQGQGSEGRDGWDVRLDAQLDALETEVYRTRRERAGERRAATGPADTQDEQDTDDTQERTA